MVVLYMYTLPYFSNKRSWHFIKTIFKGGGHFFKGGGVCFHKTHPPRSKTFIWLTYLNLNQKSLGKYFHKNITQMNFTSHNILSKVSKLCIYFDGSTSRGKHMEGFRKDFCFDTYQKMLGCNVLQKKIVWDTSTWIERSLPTKLSVYWQHIYRVLFVLRSASSASTHTKCNVNTGRQKANYYVEGTIHTKTDTNTYWHTDTNTYRHTDIQTYRHTDIQTYRHKPTHKQNSK